MDKSHLFDLPKDFLKNLYTAFRRDATEDWLDRLPYFLSATAARWDLELGAALPGLSYNYVCSVTLPRPNLKRETRNRLDIFSERLGFDRQRLWAWIVAPSHMSAWWDLREDGTGGEYAIACGEAFLELK